MATPMCVYNEIAGRFGVNPNDEKAVDRFFEVRLPRLPKETQQAILEELLSRNGETTPQIKSVQSSKAEKVAGGGGFPKRAAAFPHR